MLRSLVGSEMCIRDSCNFKTIINGNGATLEQIYAKVQYLLRQATDINTCLLYTSDAADDLLCVDLGGRRIIKKKKNKHNLVTHYHSPTTPQHLTPLYLPQHITYQRHLSN